MIDDGKAETLRLLKYLNDNLADTKFLAGDSITYADLVTTTCLQRGALEVLDEATFNAHPNLLRYYHQVLRHPDIVNVVGEPTIIAKAKEYVPPVVKEAA